MRRVLTLALCVALLAGCGGSHPRRLPVPGTTSIARGTGNASVSLHVVPVRNYGRGAHKLVVGVNMHCRPADHDLIEVRIPKVLHGFQSAICDNPEYDTLTIPAGDRFSSVKTLTVQVKTSRPGLRWAVGVETRS